MTIDRRLAQQLAMVAAVGAVITSSQAFGQDEAAAPSTGPSSTAATQTKGVLPVPEYGGKLWERDYLTGDWNGSRTDLANKGVQLDIDWVQTLQSVVSGGRDVGTRYGGSLDYVLQLDLMRMGVLPGALIKLRGETRYGESVNDMSGLILPVSIDGFMPLTDKLDETIPLTLTDVTYYQFFSETFGIYIGKLDTLDGDLNPFASGRGNTQFLNSNFVFNSAGALIVPYSTLGGGVVWEPSKQVLVEASILNTADSSTTTGFDHVENGWTASLESDFQYRIGDLPGGMNVGAAYAWAQDFAKVNGRLVLHPGEGLSSQTKDSSWCVYWSGWQYLFTNEKSDKLVDLEYGGPDREGLGLFARAGVADRDTNPIEWSVSGGLGGRGFIPSRGHDTYGLGYFYSSIVTNRLTGLVGIDDRTQGVEGYYSFAITPAAQLTLDVQWADGALPNTDAAWILGMRLYLRF